MSSGRIAFVGESEHTGDHTVEATMFLQNWFEQSCVMKGEATGPLPADSLSWISARVPCCNTRGGPREAFSCAY